MIERSFLFALLALLAAPAAAAPIEPRPIDPGPIDPPVGRRIDRILRATPLIDGHNDLPLHLRVKHGGRVDLIAGRTDALPEPLMTDLPRLRAGRVGGQFWSVYVPAEITGDQAVRMAIEQIDLVRRMVAAHPADLALATSAGEIVAAHRARRIASLIGIEGGHMIGGSLAVLRMFHALGARYLTLTHFKTNEWIDSSTDAPRHGGLAPAGRALIAEMNRLGMLVDLAHVSPEAMRDVLAIARAPLIFSHSNAAALADHSRNVPDDVLALLAANGGVAMVNFYPGHLSREARDLAAARAAEEARLKALHPASAAEVVRRLAQWDKANPRPRLTAATVADHIEHVARIAGRDHVGIGGDLDGIPWAPEGLGSVDGYPLIFAELIRRGWSDADLARLAGGNLLRAMRGAEAVAASLAAAPPTELAPHGPPPAGAGR